MTQAGRLRQQVLNRPLPKSAGEKNLSSLNKLTERK